MKQEGMDVSASPALAVAGGMPMDIQFEAGASYHNFSQEDAPKEDEGDIIYGQLIVLGTNGQLPTGDKGRRRSCFTLRRKRKATGVKPSDQHQVYQKASHSETFLSKDHHSVSYTLPRSVVVVPYVHDDNSDMFQIGRSTEEPIDFVLMDIEAGSSIPTNHKPQTQPKQSTISRFACRIVCDREHPYTSRIYAAGFDTSMNIILGEKAPKWTTEQNGKKIIDGLTTNGVLIMQPKNGFSESSTPTQWKETSVCGNIYQLRESRSAQLPGIRMPEDNNVLVNGTLIDLCGATLLWRSSSHERCMPTPLHIDELIHKLNLGRPQCPVGLTTLAFPRRSKATKETEKQPWVYLQCGHVHGRIEWGYQGEEERICPLCRSVGKYVPLWVGGEPAFYVDIGPPSYCFVPCGHVCSQKTAIYWSQTALPHGTQAYSAACPFCATPLEGDLGYKKLIFQQPLD
uniref:Pellino n=3 Tax=Ciona intestinalis TaxID=7719 RepID=Q9NDP9_CIOIN|nr:pellino protein [Ciona intestinalis]BAB00628.1 pellino [Ciona intestinalis]|eukprot:NP_001027714.1 pellino protein [Ciona intestinalis]